MTLKQLERWIERMDDVVIAVDGDEDEDSDRDIEEYSVSAELHDCAARLEEIARIWRARLAA